MPWLDEPILERDPLIQLGWDILGAMVKRRRHALGWSQRELARRTSLSQPVISRLERGILRGLKLKRLAAITAVLGGLEPDQPAPPFRAVHPEAFEPYRLDYAPPGSDLHQWLPNRDGRSPGRKLHGSSSILAPTRQERLRERAQERAHERAQERAHG